MTIQLQLPGDWPRNATWPDPLDQLQQLEQDKLDAKYEIRQVLDRYREKYRISARQVNETMWGYVDDLLERLLLREGGGAEGRDRGRHRAREPASFVWCAMSEDSRMAFGKALAVICEVSADQRTARMHLPPLQLAGVRKPISLYLDMDAEAVDALLGRLAEVRTRMLPAPKRN